MLKRINKENSPKRARLTLEGITLVLLTLFVIMGCGVSDQEPVYPHGDPAGPFYSLAVLKRFDPAMNPEMARGKEIFAQYCAICHGDSGDGKGFNAYNLKSNFGVSPFDFTDQAVVDQTTFDEVKVAIISGGLAVNRSRYMPPWGFTFSEYDLACVTSWAWHSLMKKGKIELKAQ